ncbi:TraB/GumN family protein [Phenylobacterium sp.]|uniref:TraB/GumN family protein n=1 Tax=Phenylobacterium sp. TaxID=1871053 RepID=UPI0025DBB100|nr:TraB/GumN family protein [Phenylobacterium sp.]
MRRAMAGGLVAALWMATASVAAAQPRTAIEDPEANIVSELVVQAREPGPAWWKVSDADTTVYILALSDERLPKGLAWDQRWLQRRLKGANSLIVGTRVSLRAGLGDVPALLRARAKLRSKTPLEESLREPLRSRFVAARERAGLPAKRYAGWTPLMAGAQLTEDVQKAQTAPSTMDQIIKLAKADKVKVVDPARYKAVPFVNTALASLTPSVHEQCLDGALKDLEASRAQGRAAAEGWARGDVGQALTAPRSFEKCLLLLGGGPELWRRMTADQAAAIVNALETPGHSVAVVSLRPLLAEGGVISQLRLRGVDVEGPGGD